MSVNWNWDDKCGEVTVKQMHPKESDREFTISLYNGNCMVVMLYEYKDKETGDIPVTGFLNTRSLRFPFLLHLYKRKL